MIVLLKWKTPIFHALKNYALSQLNCTLLPSAASINGFAHWCWISLRWWIHHRAYQLDPFVFYTRARNYWKLKRHSITMKLDSLFNFSVFISCLSLTAMIQAPKTQTFKNFLVLHLDRWMNLSKTQPPKSQTEDLDSSKYIHLMCTQHTQQNIHRVTLNTLHFF